MTAANLLTALPGTFLGPTAVIRIFSVAMALVSVAILVLVTRPEARRAYH